MSKFIELTDHGTGRSEYVLAEEVARVEPYQHYRIESCMVNEWGFFWDTYVPGTRFVSDIIGSRIFMKKTECTTIVRECPADVIKKLSEVL